MIRPRQCQQRGAVRGGAMSGSVGIEAARWRGTAAGHQLRILGKGCLGWREAVMSQ